MAPSPLDKQTAGCNSPHDCTPIGVIVVLAMPVNVLSKMAGNSASYPFNGWCIAIDRIYMISYTIVVNCMQASVLS